MSVDVVTVGVAWEGAGVLGFPVAETGLGLGLGVIIPEEEKKLEAGIEDTGVILARVEAILFLTVELELAMGEEVLVD